MESKNFAIYLSDFTEEARERFLKFTGPIGNDFDNFPIAVVQKPEDDFEFEKEFEEKLRRYYFGMKGKPDYLRYQEGKTERSTIGK